MLCRRLLRNRTRMEPDTSHLVTMFHSSSKSQIKKPVLSDTSLRSYTVAALQASKYYIIAFARHVESLLASKALPCRRYYSWSPVYFIFSCSIAEILPLTEASSSFRRATAASLLAGVSSFTACRSTRFLPFVPSARKPSPTFSAWAFVTQPLLSLCSSLLFSTVATWV